MHILIRTNLKFGPTMRTDEEAGGPLEVAMLARVLLEVCDTLKKV